MRESSISAMWWNIKKDMPHNCLILGDQTTVINLGWFVKKGSTYDLTKEGRKQLEQWKQNNIR